MSEWISKMIVFGFLAFGMIGIGMEFHAESLKAREGGARKTSPARRVTAEEASEAIKGMIEGLKEFR